MKTYVKNESSKELSSENQKGIEDFKKIANQLTEAAELHLEVARLIEDKDTEEALKSAVRAYGCISIIKEAQRRILSIML